MDGGTTYLGQIHFVDLASPPRLWRGEVVATPIRLQRRKQALAGNGLPKAMKAQCRALLGTKEHVGVLAGGVVHRDHQTPHRVRHPPMSAGALVNHHARQRHAFALNAVFAPDFASLDCVHKISRLL